MNEAIPPKPIGSSRFWFFMRRVWDYVFGGKFPIKGVGGIKVQWVQNQYEVSGPDSPRQTTTRDKLTTYRYKGRVNVDRDGNQQRDVLRCRTWDGTTEGTEDIFIAAATDARALADETTGLGTFTYTDYAPEDAHNFSRNSNDGSTDETQIITPIYYTNCIIRAMPADSSGVTYDPGESVGDPYGLKLIEVSARCWAKIAEEE